MEKYRKHLRTPEFDLGADGGIPMNCFTLAAGREASATGRVLVGQNEDDAGPVVVRHGLVPAAEWPAGSVLPHEEGLAALPQVPRTAGFYWREMRTQEGGLSNADGFYNEHGVLLVTNSCAWSRCDGEDASLVTEGGLAYAFRRAAAERARSAREAAEILMELAEKWGYAPSGRSYTLADSREAFMLQFARGRQYIGARVPDDHVAVMPNHYIFHGLHDWPEMFCSSGVVSFAREKGWYVPAVPGDDSDFDFARAYQAPDSYMTEANVPRARYAIRALTGESWRDGGRGMPFAVRPREKVTPEGMRGILRSHFEGTEDDALRFGPGQGPHDTPTRRICTSTTLESTLALLRDDPKRSAFFLAPGRPCAVPYFRLHPLCGLPEALDPMKDPAKALAGHLLGDDTAVAGETRGAVRACLEMQTLLEGVYAPCCGAVREETDALFDEGLREDGRLLKEAGTLPEAAGSALLAKADGLFADRVLKAVRALTEETLHTASVTGVTGLAGPGADGRVRVRFACRGIPEKETLRFGAAGLNVRLRHAPCAALERMERTERMGEEWTAVFERADIESTLPRTGRQLFCLSGGTGEGPFSALWCEAF